MDLLLTNDVVIACNAKINAKSKFTAMRRDSGVEDKEQLDC